jgi:hypothetical protein
MVDGARVDFIGFLAIYPVWRIFKSGTVLERSFKEPTDLTCEVSIIFNMAKKSKWRILNFHLFSPMIIWKQIKRYKLICL